MLDLFTLDWRDYWQGVEHSEPVGAIFTKPEVVRLILDLAEYKPSKRLADFRLLEPSCGDGAFLTEIVERLIASERKEDGSIDWDDFRLEQCIRAADISLPSVTQAREQAASLLVRAGCSPERAHVLCDAWILHTDFLLASWPGAFDFVIGNPPYVRIEDLPKPLLSRYRELYETTSDRADIYVAFIQRGLEALSARGVLSYICANRFAKNKYGAPLRRLIANKYRVRHFLNLEHTQPFLADVSAYPAIVVIDRHLGQHTNAGTLGDLSEATLRGVQEEANGSKRSGRFLSRFERWYPQGEPWTSTSSKEHATLSRLGRTLPTLEDSAPRTRVGIGVATGADRVFIVPSLPPDIERTRLLPLAMSRDVSHRKVDWSGSYLINPFRDEDDGQLVDLKQYPGLAAHFDSHSELLRGRHVAKSRSDSWFRTIDRIWPSLLSTPKLLIPDIQSGSVVGLDDGAYYPHHNLYWITSETWPLEALRALLRSEQVTLQVRAFSVQMRGGSLRYQAQTLRQIRIPRLASLSDDLVSRLEASAASEDPCELDELAREAYAGA